MVIQAEVSLGYVNGNSIRIQAHQNCNEFHRKMQMQFLTAMKFYSFHIRGTEFLHKVGVYFQTTFNPM